MTGWPGVRDKQLVITGATNGIGLAAAEALAALGAKLAIVARSEARASTAVARIRAAAGDDAVVDVFQADLSSQASVRQLAADLLARLPRIDVLANNAGGVYLGSQVSADGIEMTWAVNHLAPFLLTNLLLERLRESAPARVITTSSDAHAGATIPFDLLEHEPGKGGGGARYGQSKLANILFTTELARRLEGTGVTANCFHPGLVRTGFGQNNGPLLRFGIRLGMALGRPFMRTPEQGAATLVWLANSPEMAGETGGYYVDERRTEPSKAAQDVAAAGRLWTVSEALTGVPAGSA